MLIGVFITFYDYLLLLSDISAGRSEGYSLINSLAFNTFAGLIGGFLGGIALTEINLRSQSKPYYYGLLTAGVIFIFIVALITFLTSAVPPLFLFEQPLSNPASKAYFLEKVSTLEHVKNILFWGVIVMITQFSIQISDKFGPKNLWRMITGKYHIPSKENRVFMFLDLKSSTTIAEKLGEEKYHDFLKEVFRDITLPILNSKAEIYQYVGDEVVISWDLEVLNQKELYIECFYQIKTELENKQEYYETKFGASPEFKAGAHYGQVIAGEIGVIKREITYSGDVLNTTARIQSQCNALDASLLISGKLHQYVEEEGRKWTFLSKGFIPLKGKEKEVELFSVEEG